MINNQKPGIFFLSQNEVLFRFTSNTETSCYIDIYIDNELLYTDYLEFIDNETVFDISAYLNTKKFPHNQEIDGYFEHDIVQSLYIDYYSENGTKTRSSTFYFLVGGISNELFNFYKENTTTFYSQQIKSKKKFLDFKPSICQTFIDSIERLFYLNETYSQIKLKANIYFTDNSQNLHEVISLSSSNYSVYEFDLSMSYIIYRLSLTKQIKKYEIFLCDSSDKIITEKRIFKADYKVYPHALNIVFLNSLGIVDNFYFKGVHESNNTFSRTVANNSFQQNLSNTYKDKDKANSGWVSQEAYSYLIDMLLSTDVRIIHENYIQKILITNKNFQKHLTNDYLYNVEIQYSNVFEESKSAPLDFSLILPTFICEDAGSDTTVVAGLPINMKIKVTRTDLHEVEGRGKLVFDFGTLGKRTVLFDISHNSFSIIETSVIVPTDFEGNYSVQFSGVCNSLHNYAVVQALVINVNMTTPKYIQGYMYFRSGNLFFMETETNTIKQLPPDGGFGYTFTTPGLYKLLFWGTTFEQKTLEDFRLNSCNIFGNIDLSKHSFHDSIYFSFNYNALLENIIFQADTVIERVYTINCYSLKKLDLSQITIRRELVISGCNNMTELIFSENHNFLARLQMQGTNIANNTLDVRNVELGSIQLIGKDIQTILSQNYTHKANQQQISGLKNIDLSAWTHFSWKSIFYNTVKANEIIFGNATAHNHIFQIQNHNFLYFDISPVTFSGDKNYIDLYNNRNLKYFFIKPNSPINRLRLSSCTNLDADHVQFSNISTIASLQFESCAFDTTMVNKFLVRIMEANISNCSIQIHGSNSSPDSSSGGFDGIAAKNYLVNTLNCTVTTN